MRKLIINADDFGYNKEITDGIIESHLHGVVTSTTAMANMGGIEYAATLRKNVPNLSIGIHFNLTQGKPVSAPDRVYSLVNREGNFYSFGELFKRTMMGKVKLSEVKLELSNQIEKLRGLGFELSHWDSHHHSTWIPVIFPVACNIAKKYSITAMRVYRVYRFDNVDSLSGIKKSQVQRLSARIYYNLGFWMTRNYYKFKTPDYLLLPSRLSSKFEGESYLECWIRGLAYAPEGISEFFVHPGFYQEDPSDKPLMRIQRQKELEALTDPSLREAIEKAGVEIVSFRELVSRQ
jgi:predicted glycoside hydrolase/deacetylase ChbG (UPF0249 family)